MKKYFKTTKRQVIGFLTGAGSNALVMLPLKSEGVPKKV